MLDRARDTDNIELVTPYVVQSFEPGEDGALGHAVLENTEDASTKEIPITGAFVAIGHKPNSHLVDGQVDLDDDGYVLVEGRSTRTKLPGVFAAGDLTDRVYRQAVTAAGTGCMAALDAEAYLRDTPIDAEAHWAPDVARVEAAAESAAHTA
jgi:thioredoxin reductase (NADPH)